MSSLVVANGVVVPVVPRGVVHEPGWVRVEDSRIAEVGAGAPRVEPGDEVVDARGGLVLPGFVSAHQHVLDILLRGGVRVGPSFLDWLLGLYYAGMACYEPPDAYVATMLGGAESIHAGVTTIVDNWGVCGGDSAARIEECAVASLTAYARLGLRVVFARMFATSLPEPWRAAVRVPYDLDRLVAPYEPTLAAIDALASSIPAEARARIAVCAAPELPEMVAPAELRATLLHARAHGTLMPTHLLASDASRSYADAAALDATGALGPEVLGAHCTAATDEDVALLAARRVSIAHCPTSSAALGHVTSAGRFRAAGCTVGLGSDNASLNRNSDILAEARQALLVSRALGPGDTWISATDAVEMATIEGARAIGRAEEIGSLTAGKRADLVVLDTSGPRWSPRHDWLETLVMQGRSSDVRTVIVDGRVVMRDGALPGIDEVELAQDAQRASERLLARAGLAPA